MSAQDPASELAWITEGIMPLRMKHENFIISGALWRKFNFNRPWLTLSEFWMYKERAYDRRNAQSKCFFPKFTRDKKRHAKVLPARALCREIKQILNTEVLYAPAAGLLEPKPEPVEEALGAYCFMYRVQDDFMQDDLSKLLFVVGLEFEAYLRRMAEDTIDFAVCNVID